MADGEGGGGDGISPVFVNTSLYFFILEAGLASGSSPGSTNMCRLL